MIALLRAVARSKPYRRNRPRLSQEPVDIWHVPDEGWVVMYRLLGPDWGQVLVFVLDELTEDGKTAVISASAGAEEGWEVVGDVELDLSLD